jgi:hypothetical protein
MLYTCTEFFFFSYCNKNYFLWSKRIGCVCLLLIKSYCNIQTNKHKLKQKIRIISGIGFQNQILLDQLLTIWHYSDSINVSTSVIFYCNFGVLPHFNHLKYICLCCVGWNTYWGLTFTKFKILGYYLLTERFFSKYCQFFVLFGAIAPLHVASIICLMSFGLSVFSEVLALILRNRFPWNFVYDKNAMKIS